MSKGGLIIRLIDVALILLLGFIAISDIRVKAQIKLPSPGEEDVLEQATQLVFVLIYGHGFAINLNEKTTPVKNLQILENQLLQIRTELLKNNIKMVVLIEPHEESIIQKTVDVLDICEKRRIPKNINYQSLEL